LRLARRAASLLAVREMIVGIFFCAVNLNQGGSMEGIPPDPTGHRWA
jgi:hypothetical protein